MTEKPLLRTVPPDATELVETEIDVDGRKFLVQARGKEARTLAGRERGEPVDLKGTLEHEEWTTARSHKRSRVLVMVESVCLP